MRPPLAATLAQASAPAAADALLAVAADEDARSDRNELPPYADELPPALGATAPSRVALVAAQLTGAQLHRVLFGNFRQLSWGWLGELAVELDAATMAGLLDAMALGVDAPRQAARLLAARAAIATEGAVLEQLPAESSSRVLGVVDMGALQISVRRDTGGGRWLAAATAAAAPAEALRLESAGTGPDGPALEPMPLALPGIVHALQLMGPAAIVERLRLHGAAWQRSVLDALSAGVAAAVLVRWGKDDPGHAGRLLAGLSEWALHPEAGGRRRVLYRARGAAVLDAADDEVREGLLGLLAPATAQAFLRRSAAVSPGDRGTYPAPPHQVSPVQRDERRRGVVVERHQRALAGGDGELPVRVDLVELDPREVSVRVCHTGSTVPFSWMAERTGDAVRGDARPQEALFRDLGLVRLSEVVRDAHDAHAVEAVAGINGNFYLDYGHYLDALDLGIDLGVEPHVHLGDAIGWFVSGGDERTPPGVNRATLLVDEAGAVQIRRVAARAVVVRGEELGWDQVDGPGAAGLHTRLACPTTPVAPGVVDLTVSHGHVVRVQPGGGSAVPLLGFVLSLPEGHAALLSDVEVDESVAVVPDLPPGGPRVVEAMACGPLLVRDSQVDIDFAAEGFGDKDAGLPPLSLTRAVDSFRAARSFLMVRGGRLVFGAVSGTQVGHGPVGVSAGVTFGELAALCVELGAEAAMALDGGGSSTLVVQGDGGPSVVNVPTGGADVPPGAERFIATYLLALSEGSGG